MHNGLLDLFLGGVSWELQESKNNNKTTSSLIVEPVKPIDAGSAMDAACELCAGANDWESLCGALLEFQHPLRALAKNTVMPSRADNNPRLVVITDLPSVDDDGAGQILSGAAGDLFNKMIGAIGLSRNDVIIIPLVFWRTPGGRTPLPEEVEICRPFVNRFIKLSGARNILTLGTLAAEQIAGASLPRQHGALIPGLDGANIIPIFHPNYMLLRPDAKRAVWDALQALHKIIDN